MLAMAKMSKSYTYKSLTQGKGKAGQPEAWVSSGCPRQRGVGGSAGQSQRPSGGSDAPRPGGSAKPGMGRERGRAARRWDGERRKAEGVRRG